MCLACGRDSTSQWSERTSHFKNYDACMYNQACVKDIESGAGDLHSGF